MGERKRFWSVAVVLGIIWVAAKGITSVVPSGRDHAKLAEFVHTHAAPGTALVAVDRPQSGLYGLEFYLDRILPTMSETDGTLDHFLSEWHESPHVAPTVLVTKASRASYLLPALYAQRMAGTGTPSRFWTMVSLRREGERAITPVLEAP